MSSFFAFLAILVLFIRLADTRSRLKRAEATLAEAANRIGALQRLTGMLPPKDEPGQSPVATPPVAWTQTPAIPVSVPVAPPPEPDEPRAAAKADAGSAGSIVTQEVPKPEEAAAPAAVEPEMAVVEPEVEPEPKVEPETPLAAPTGETATVAPATPPALPRSMASRFEELVGKKLPIWAGGITLAIAGVLIVKYAIDAGFFGRIFTHGVQVVSGTLFGLGLIAGAEFAWRNEAQVRDVRVPQALSGAGIATLYAAVLVAANAYGLIGPVAAFAALAAITAAALGLSLRFGPPSALLGLAGGLAAPALTGAMAPNVPLLSVYLGLTIAGLVGVSRMRRWPWLAIAALIGGAGWSLWMMLAANAFDVLGSLSIGGFVLLLAIALPMLAFDGVRGTLLRTASAVIGALQLALLVAYGGFTPLHWGLFALIAAAGQFLAWRDGAFAIVPTIGLALSALLLAIWPHPTPFWFAAIGLSLAAIHAPPLLARLWQAPAGLQRTLELCALAIAAPLLAKWHFWHMADTRMALIALGGAVLAGAGIALGWKQAGRQDDSRFAWLTTTAAALLALATLLVLPHWQAPLGIAAIAAALLFFGKAARDGRIEGIAAGFAGASLPVLVATMPALFELPPLLAGAGAAISTHAVIRWLGLAALFALFAAKADSRELRFAALTIAGGLTYGTLAQMVPGWSLPLAMAAVALVLFGIGQLRASLAVEGLSSSFAVAGVALLALTGPGNLAQWTRLFASDAVIDATALLRWGTLAALYALIAWRAASAPLRLFFHAAAGALAYGLLAQFLPGWSLPLGLAVITAALMLIGERGWTDGVSALSVLFALATLPVLTFSSPNAFAEWSRLRGSDAAVTGLSALRWGGLALLALLYAMRARGIGLQRTGQVAAALLGYGTCAQLVPSEFLMLVPALVGGAGLLLAARRFDWRRLACAVAALAALSLAWAFVPLVTWANAAALSLGGIPMTLDPAILGLIDVTRRLLAPALLLGGALWFVRDRLPQKLLVPALGSCAVLAGIALHCLYRIGFAVSFGSDFVQTGLGERLVWEALLIGTGWLALRRLRRPLALGLAITGTTHALWHTLLLHNPLWTAQAVGGVPLANLLAPTFAMVPLGLLLIARLWPTRPAWTTRAWQMFVMVLVAGFAWASLRQGFHGTLLTDPGTFPVENILRSILMLALAIGYLLWGIRAKRHDWRIASLVLMLGAAGKVFLFDASGLEGLLRIGSFVALGFSLIGIGWLYSRQLAGAAAHPEAASGPETASG